MSTSLRGALAKIVDAEEKAKDLRAKAELDAKERTRKAEAEARSGYDETYEAYMGKVKAASGHVDEARESARAEADQVLKEAEKRLESLRKQAQGRLEEATRALADELLKASWGDGDD